MRAVAPTVLLVLTAACGEAEVTYQGAVVEGSATLHVFADAPATGRPVVGAAVALCRDDLCGTPALTDGDGV